MAFSIIILVMFMLVPTGLIVAGIIDLITWEIAGDPVGASIMIFFGVFIIILVIEASRHIYPAGTYYSTVKIKDFKAKK